MPIKKPGLTAKGASVKNRKIKVRIDRQAGKVGKWYAALLGAAGFW